MFNLTGAAFGGNLVLNSAGLTGLSGAVSTYSTGSAINYSVNGVLPTAKATISGASAPTVDVAQTAFLGANTAFKPQTTSTAAVYVFTLDASGNVGVAQGPIAPWIDTSAKSTPLNFPAIPDTVTPFAYVVIKLGATGTSWTFGTGLWNATGIVIDPVVNVSLLPGTDAITA